MEIEQQKVKVLTPVVVDGGWTIGIATWGEHGYTPTGKVYPNEEEAKKVCNDFNERHGYNEKQAWMIVMKTMFPKCIYTLEDVLNAGTKVI